MMEKDLRSAGTEAKLFAADLEGRQPVTENERSEFEVALRVDEKGRKSMYCAVLAQKQRFLQQIKKGDSP